MNTFYGKILLFGEYSVLYGSNALAVPLRLYSGQLRFNTRHSSEAGDSNKHLYEYLAYLRRNQSKFPYLNLSAFEHDLKDGLYFESSIPRNYGVGSSGALVAAIFKRYFFSGDNMEENLIILRAMLTDLESWFHGKSSGIDPLVSYLNKPVIIRNNIPEPTELYSFGKDDFKIFLINTNQESSTGLQIRSFQQILKNRMFNHLFLKNYIPHINTTISSLNKRQYVNFNDVIADIVDFQYKHFRILFPSSTHKLIKQGLKEHAYYLKLCGSGGGGFLLGFTKDIEYTRKLMAAKNIELIEVEI